MDVLDQIQKLIKQAAENNERIQKKYKWFLDKQQEIIEKIRGLDNKINNIGSCRMSLGYVIISLR